MPAVRAVVAGESGGGGEERVRREKLGHRVFGYRWEEWWAIPGAPIRTRMGWESRNWSRDWHDRFRFVAAGEQVV